MGKGVIPIAFLLILSISLIAAQPGFIQGGEFTTGYKIKVPPISPIKQNTNFDFNFHVFNISNGVPIDNSSTDCFFHLYNSTGDHALIVKLEHEENNVNNEWALMVNGNNFSSLGSYSYVVQCNSTTLGGFESVEIHVTKLGTENKTSEALIYILLTLAVVFIFLLSLYFMLATPYSNKANSKGAVIKVTRLKYIKLALILLTYVLFTWVLNVLIALSDNLAGMTLFTGFIGFIFELLINLTLPLGVFIVVLAFWEMFKDAKISENIKKFGSYRR